MIGKYQYLIIYVLVISVCLISFNSCKTAIKKEMTKNEIIEQKIDSLLAMMTLEEKIGQMTQVRHFDSITDDEIATKFIGSVIHTNGPAPGEDAAGWQAKFVSLQKKALSSRLGIPLLFAVDAVHGQNTFDGASKKEYSRSNEIERGYRRKSIAYHEVVAPATLARASMRRASSASRLVIPPVSWVVRVTVSLL